MSHTEIGMRVAGAWLAAASVLLIVTFLGHGPIHPDLGQQMKDISHGMSRWVIVHWIAAVSLSLFAGASLVVLTTGSRLIESWWALSAWALLPVGALWTMTTAVAEATVVANAATANDVARFEAWWAFAEGNANGFMALCLAVAVIAANETRSDQVGRGGRRHRRLRRLAARHVVRRRAGRTVLGRLVDRDESLDAVVRAWPGACRIRHSHRSSRTLARVIRHRIIRH